MSSIKFFVETIIKPFKNLRLRFYKRRVNRSLRVLDALDWNMRRAGYTRMERRQFWRDFISKQNIRTETLVRLTQE